MYRDERRNMTYLYRLWGQEGDLLYVGITNNVKRRSKQHKRDKHWWEQVQSKTISEFPTREAALQAEYHAIKSECPKYNIACYLSTMDGMAGVERKARWRAENRRRHLLFYQAHKEAMTVVRMRAESEDRWADVVLKMRSIGYERSTVRIPINREAPWVAYPPISVY
jgi:predicted GIY-YIG superfamily endonuclease